MTAAYIYFGKPINPDTATALINACRTIAGETNVEGGFAWSSLEIAIGSTGGDVASAFSLFNELSSIEIEINTHNIGSVDSAAIMPFMVGKRRTAAAISGFMFHQSAWTFAPGPVTRTSINDSARWLGLYDGMMADTVSSGSKLARDEMLRMMQEGASLTPDEALAAGLIHAIEERRLPRTARWWQV